MRPPFAVQSSDGRSPTVSAQRVVNAFPEIQPEDAKARLVLFGTPGARSFATVGAGPLKAMIATAGALYCVSGPSVYKVTSDGTATLLGSVPDVANVTMERNRLQVIICAPPEMYVLTTATDTLTQVTDSDFPGASSVAVLDGYAIFTKPGSDEWGLTAIDDASDIDALDFATAESAPDNLVRAFVDHRELWLFGEQTTEVWYNAGGADFPFQRVSGAHLETGCGAFGTVAKIDNSVFWLGDDYKVYRAQGYQGTRISNHAIEEQVRKITNKADAFAWTYNQGGHAFYVLTFPNGGRTWVYDAATQLWHERESYGQARYRWNAAAYAFGKVIVGDQYSGGLYELDMDTFTEAGQPLVTRVIGPPVHADGKRAFASFLEVEFENGVGLTTGQGSAPQVALRWSDNDGRNWSPEYWRGIGAIGDGTARATWSRLGSFRKRIYQISISDPVKRVIVAANPELTASPRN